MYAICCDVTVRKYVHVLYSTLKVSPLYFKQFVVPDDDLLLVRNMLH